MTDCLEMLMNNVCNMNEFIRQIKNIPDTITEQKEACNVWTLNWAILLGFLTSLVSKKNQEAPDGNVRRLMNLINIFGTKYPELSQIIPYARAAQPALDHWNKQLLSNYIATARRTPSNLGYLEAVNMHTITMNPSIQIPDFDVLLIVGGPAAECRIRLKIMMQYLKTLEESLSEGDGKTRQIIISGRGGKYLRKDATEKNWNETESKTVLHDKTEAEYILRLFLSEFTQEHFPKLYSQCTISIDTGALDTVGNAVMAKYLILQNKFFNPAKTGDGGGGEGKEAANFFLNKTIVSISNTYHITRLLYLMKNFMPMANHYGVVLGNDAGDETLLTISKSQDAANSILAAYQQTFTRDVGYIIPTLSRQCIDNPTAQLDLGLFEFLMHHGLYHRPSDVDSKTGANDTIQIWRTYMTSKDLITAIGDFCLPFTSLGTDLQKTAVTNTRIFKENCTVAQVIMKRAGYDVKKFTFNEQSCTVPAPPGKYPVNDPFQSHRGGKRKKKRSRRKRKKKRKKNKTQKK
jgi:hypothetical protein